MNRKIKKEVQADHKLSLEQELELLSSGELDLMKRYLGNYTLYPQAQIELVKMNDLDLLKAYCSERKRWLCEDAEILLLQTAGRAIVSYYISNFGLHDKAEAELIDARLCLPYTQNNELIKQYVKRGKMCYAAEKKLLYSGKKDVILCYLEKTSLDVPLQLKLFGLDRDYIVLYIKEHNLCAEAQEKLLESNDKDLLELYVKYHPFFTERLQIDFFKKATFEIINEYCQRWQLTNGAQIELVKNYDWNLVKTYLNNFELCNHAWQLFMTKIHIGL